MFDDLQIGNPNNAYLVEFCVLIVALAIGSAILKRRALARFASGALRSTIAPARTAMGMIRSAVSILLVVLCIIFLSAALMDLRWGKTAKQVPQKGIEVMFALDVSRSMLAEDVSPNRLERAKQQIKDMIEQMAGDRVGLVVFAGEAIQAVPLTTHYDDFYQVLETVGRHSIRRGGSSLGDAIQAAADGFISKTNEHKTIVLITDGEDQESQPVELARQLHEENKTRIFTIGLGDVEQGAPIPDDLSRSRLQKYVQYDGKQVWSKLNGQVLRAIATETDGAYIPCLLYTSPSPRDGLLSRMPSSA